MSPAGSHKPNTALAQVYYNKISGTKRITTETGAGQWGSALAMCCCLFGLECKVFMVKVSYNQKPYRRIMMETWGANCVASPSQETKAGQKVLEQDPDSPGSLGIAISEGIEAAVTGENTKYSLGSVLNHVMLHQTVNGLECQKQMAIAGDYPDVIIGCAGGKNTEICLPLDYEEVPAHYRRYRIKASEMRGGHSGVDIHRQRANAIQVLGRVLHAAITEGDLRVSFIHGGTVSNAIPRDAEAIVFLPEEALAQYTESLSTMETVLRTEFYRTDPELTVTLEPHTNEHDNRGMTCC